MKKSLFSVRVMVIVAAFLGLNIACTNLDEELFSEVTPDNFFSTDEEFISALGAAYTQFRNYASGDILSLQETTTDEMVVPTRGQDWDDGGMWRRTHLHSWTYEDGYTNGGWNFGFSGVNTANRLIYQFQTLVENGQVEQSAADAFIAGLSVASFTGSSLTFTGMYRLSLILPMPKQHHQQNNVQRFSMR